MVPVVLSDVLCGSGAALCPSGPQLRGRHVGACLPVSVFSIIRVHDHVHVCVYCTCACTVYAYVHVYVRVHQGRGDVV